jgi:hypothetical protein
LAYLGLHAARPHALTNQDINVSGGAIFLAHGDPF